METESAPPAAEGAEEFAAELAQLEAMGFSNRAACLQALRAAGGNIETALQFLM
eukprot:m.187553 g.187553  ORF g.187553 m.187553 type:complete len:54 (+) comp10547_c2_seq1:1104-1265(+)